MVPDLPLSDQGALHLDPGSVHLQDVDDAAASGVRTAWQGRAFGNAQAHLLLPRLPCAGVHVPPGRLGTLLSIFHPLFHCRTGHRVLESLWTT